MDSREMEQRSNDAVHQSALSETNSNIEKGFHKHAEVSGLDDAALEVSSNRNLCQVVLG